MIKVFSAILIISALVSRTVAAPAHNNPWFTWRSLDHAEKQLRISKAFLNHELCVFSNKNHQVVFKNNSRMAEVDGIRVWLNVAPEADQDKKKWKVAAVDLDLVSLAMRAQAEKKPKPLKVMIDAGHGGKDPGAISNCRSLKEKDINLDLALKTGKVLKKAGMKVLYTRTKDRTLSLTDRTAVAYRQKADVFISIHANKASNRDASGIETFVLTPSGYPGSSANSRPRGWQIGNKNDYNSNLLGFAIQKALIDESDTFDRGLKRQSFFVLRETYCPATLVEVGFLSNTEDLKKLKCEKWRQKCAEKISAGVLTYCRKVDSLEKAVVAKRKKDAEASRRWKQYIAAKKSGRSEADLHKTESDVDLNKLTASDVQSVATNIYLTKEESRRSERRQNESDLRSLMRFYEKGSLN